MKAEITGYITALINVYAKKLNTNTNLIAKACNFEFKNELNDLLDFVVDVPEEVGPLTVVLENGEINKSRKRIKELEESCQQMCDIERNLQKKIENLKSDNLAWKITCTGLSEKLEDLEAKNK